MRAPCRWCARKMVSDTVLSVDDARVLAAAAEVRRGTARLARRLRAERSAGALSASKVGVLSWLHRAGPSTPGAVALAERQQPQSLTRVFAELERDGYLVRRSNEADRRGAVLELTERGRALLERDMSERDAWLAAALADLTDIEVEMLRLAGILLDRLADANPDMP
jgi:DNA-binding MarR family transcriptional regulator